jgi:hypothetical protein
MTSVSVSAVEGVPLIKPEDEQEGNPPVPGTLEDFDHVYGGVPPIATS